MRMSRIAIAAVFFVVGALILIPLIVKSSAGSKAASKISTKVSPTLGITISPKPTHKPAPTPSHHKKSPSPSPHATGAAPLTATVSAVRCPGRMVQVTVADVGAQAEDYAILQNGSISVADRITPGTTRKTSIVIDEGKTTAVSITWGNNQPLRTVRRTASCASRPVNKQLPFTGPDRGLLIARIATGIAALLTGIVIFWYGRLWPRRRDNMFD
jgi:hypothetical protein